MPIYEYRCENGHTFEAFQSMIDDSLDTCEVCEAPAARVLSAPAVHFKGSGFYTTDYARKGAKNPSGEGGGSGSGSDSGSKDSGDSGGSGDSKSSGKSESGSGSGSSSGSKGSEKAGSGSSSSSKSSD